MEDNVNTDVILFVVAFLGLISIFSIVLYFGGYFHEKKKEEKEEEEVLNRPRGGLAGLRQRRRGQQHDNDNNEDINNEPMTKKQIQKENKRKEREEMRQFEEQQREEQKKRMDAKDEAYRLKLEEREEEELKKEEKEAELKKQQELKEQEEFNKWKSMFSTDEEGAKGDIADGTESQELLEEFVQYIEKHKVVVLEDLAAEFGLQTQEAVERVEQLQEMQRLSGIMDDRGKFICITNQEMDKVAQYIRKKGRISISELATASNRLIQINS